MNLMRCPECSKECFESSKGGTFKLANPTELSTELSVNQVDPLGTIFRFIQSLLFSLQIYFLCPWFVSLHSYYSIQIWIFDEKKVEKKTNGRNNE